MCLKNAYEIVASGTIILDIDNLSNNGSILASYHGDSNSIGGTHTLTFTFAQQTTVTIGWVVNEGTNTYNSKTSR